LATRSDLLEYRFDRSVVRCEQGRERSSHMGRLHFPSTVQVNTIEKLKGKNPGQLFARSVQLLEIHRLNVN
jgi:hypothetical protein